MKALPIDDLWLRAILRELLEIPSPTGYTDTIVHRLLKELRGFGVEWEVTRRGAVRARLPGRKDSPKRALVAHLDTLGAMISSLKENGRPMITPIGTWSARFAEGARVVVYTDKGSRRGTILPLKASGHVYNDAVDTQPVAWDNLEIRLDEPVSSRRQLEMLGVHVGDYVAIEAEPEFRDNGYINSRHLDDKAGVAVVLAAAKAVLKAGCQLPVPVHLVFTISEEVGSGAAMLFDHDVSELVAVDNGTCAPGQNHGEFGATIVMKDASGPFDYHLSHHLLDLCTKAGIDHQRDVFHFYRCDAAAAIESGNDIRSALLAFGVDASHGYERTHIDSLRSVAELLTLYMQSEPVRWNDRFDISNKDDLPTQPNDEAPPTFTH